MTQFELVPETKEQLHKLLAEIGNDPTLCATDRLSNHELAGEFATRYVLKTLLATRASRCKTRQRRKRKGARL